MSDSDILARLLRKIRQGTEPWDLFNAYYEGARRLQAIGLALPPGMEDLQVIVNWPGMWVDALEERLDVEGFRLAGATENDDRLWEWWQANDLDEESGLAHTEALFSRRSYAVVGYPDDEGDPPVITVESSRYMAHEIDPRSRRVSAAARLYGDDEAGRPQYSALYLPNRNVYYARSNSGWVREDIIEHGRGRVLVEPLVNRERLGPHRSDGVTEMRDVMEIADAACRSITTLQGAQEILAVPQQYIFGATEQDFVDQNGNVVPKWEAYLGRLRAIPNEQAKIMQVGGADLRNFTEVVNFYARTVSGLTGLPAHYLGFSSDNPASADAIRSGETRLVKKAERKQRAFGASWERVMRLALLVAGEDPAQARRLETVWRDPATPTVAAKADAVTKMVQAGILPIEAAWEELGYSTEQRRRLRSMTSQDPATRYLETIEQMRQRQGGQSGGGAPAGQQPEGRPAEGAAA